MSISLIIPNRNHSRFLQECLESVLGQSLPYDEIIVVDDASDDDSQERLLAFASKEPRIRVVFLARRSGVSMARDTGIRAANSLFVSTLDSDDFLWNRQKNELEWQVIQRASDAHPTIAFSDVQRVAVDGQSLGLVSTQRRIREGALFESLLFLRGFIPRDFTFPRSAYFAAGGYDARLNLYEDWDLKLRLSRLCDFRYTGATGVAYRMNPSGLSRAPVLEHFKTMCHVARKNTEYLKWPRRDLARLGAFVGISWFLRGALRSSAKRKVLGKAAGKI
jgi:glycosyltransferase involved in cell wall biosynthesis